jgi:hypothetical protein
LGRIFCAAIGGKKTMSYAERIRHPHEALNPPPEKQRSANLWFYVATAIAAVILMAILRPKRLSKISVKIPSGAAPNGIPNQHGWV